MLTESRQGIEQTRSLDQTNESEIAGLIGWVNNCDTLHMLIKEHREENKIIPNIDYRLMDSFC